MLYLSGEHTEFTYYPPFMKSVQQTPSTENNIGEIGTASLRDALMTNTTLTQLNLKCLEKNRTGHQKRWTTLFTIHNKSQMIIIISMFDFEKDTDKPITHESSCEW